MAQDNECIDVALRQQAQVDCRSRTSPFNTNISFRLLFDPDLHGVCNDVPMRDHHAFLYIRTVSLAVDTGVFQEV